MDWIWWTLGYKTNKQIELENKKASVIQKAYRIHIKRSHSASLIQRKYREFSKAKKSALLIQKIWKKYVQKIEEKLNKLWWESERRRIKKQKNTKFFFYN
jgi:hypothetical protein